MAKNKDRPKRESKAKVTKEVKTVFKKEPEALTNYRDALVLAKSNNNTMQVKLLEKIIKKIENKNK